MSNLPPLPPNLQEDVTVVAAQPVAAPATSVAVSESAPAPVLWSQERLELLKKTIAVGLTNDQFALFVEICKRRKLDPFAKQIYAVLRDGKMVVQTSIDGYRLIADRSGMYAGQAGPYWCGADGQWTDVWTKKENPWAAKIGVYKHGFVEPVWGVAYWDTYASYGPFWKKAGAHMLAKCAEALALKKAFPEELSGLYTEDEMGQADTMVAQPIAAEDIEQPVLIFIQKVVNSWTDNTGQPWCLIQDQNNQEWMFSGTYFPDLDKAMSEGTPLLVYFTVEMNRRVVSGIATQ